jgi:hypothetical protein
MNDKGHADERDLQRIDARLEALKASFESEIRRLDQVIALGEKGVNAALIAAEKAVGAALAAADKATEKAEKNTEESFSKVNEFRGALEDLGRLMATRRELEDFKESYRVAHETLRSSIIGLGTRLDTAPEVRALVSRADIGQGERSGAVERTNTSRANVALWVALAGVGLAALLGILAYTHNATPAAPPICFNAAHVQIVCP